MSNKNLKKMIAFRSIDSEGDIWCEQAFLFENEDAVNAFFQNENEVLLDVFTTEDSAVLNDFVVFNTPTKIINCVTFNTNYAGDVKICRMHKGFVIH